MPCAGAQTTLMDVIAGRKTQGEIRGDILVNGYPKNQATWARVVGYVEQNDIHSPQVRSCSSCAALTRLNTKAGHVADGCAWLATWSRMTSTHPRLEFFPSCRLGQQHLWLHKKVVSGGVMGKLHKLPA